MVADLKFNGPLYQYATVEDYITALKNDPPIDCKFELRHITSEHDRVVIFYEFIRPEVHAVMAQYFHFEAGLIDEICLVFDTGNFVIK